MEVVDALQEYRRNGGAILFSSHVLFDVERLADRFVMIDHGEVKADMSMQALETLSTHYRVRSSGSTPPEAMRADGEQTWIGDVERGQLERHLVRLVEQGHRIIEVRPILNLETLYLKISRENQPS